ncbi:MAG: hypothetical protein AB8U16_03605 [Rickettsiales endosymbiont of Dermacentor nuttalli]
MDKNSQDKQDMMALHHAAYEQKQEAVIALIKANVNIDAQERGLYSTLHFTSLDKKVMLLFYII